MRMPTPRKKRTKNFKTKVELEWVEHFWKFIENNSNKPWSWDYLSINPNITFDIVLAHPYKPWNWYYLSLNPNITLDNVLAHHNAIRKGLKKKNLRERCFDRGVT